MRTLSLYVDKNTPVHRVDPITKLLYVFVFSLSPFILPAIETASIFLLVNMITLLIGRVLSKVIPFVSFVFFVIITIFIIQGLYYPGNQTIVFSLLSLEFYQEGLLFAARIALRVFNILLAFSILILTTKPSELIESLVRRGLPPKMGYVMSSVLQIIPTMSSTASTIMDAQRSRGMETEGNLWVRMKAFLPLIGPLVMNSLVSTHERSLALEVRAFSARTKKTFLNDEHIPSGMLIVRILLLLIIIAVIVWRLIG